MRESAFFRVEALIPWAQRPHWRRTPFSSQELFRVIWLCPQTLLPFKARSGPEQRGRLSLAECAQVRRQRSQQLQTEGQVRGMGAIAKFW